MTARGAEWERETHTATAWGTQESGAGELHGEARAGGRTPGNPPPRPPTRRERGAAMVRGRRKGGDKEAGGKHVPEKPRECGATTGAARPPEWRKNHRVLAREWAEESSCHRATTPPE